MDHYNLLSVINMPYSVWAIHWFIYKAEISCKEKEEEKEVGGGGLRCGLAATWEAVVVSNLSCICSLRLSQQLRLHMWGEKKS